MPKWLKYVWFGIKVIARLEKTGVIKVDRLKGAEEAIAAVEGAIGQGAPDAQRSPQTPTGNVR